MKKIRVDKYYDHMLSLYVIESYIMRGELTMFARNTFKEDPDTIMEAAVVAEQRATLETHFGEQLS